MFCGHIDLQTRGVKMQGLQFEALAVWSIEGRHLGQGRPGS